MNYPSRMRLAAALTGLLLTLCNVTALRADVKPAALFGDHMVLQQGMSAPVWGWADPGEQVTVSIAGQKQSTTAGADRKWMVRLKDLKTSADPIEMTIAGKNTITIKDILVGEVWLGSGQSNMDFVVSGDMAKYPGMAQRFAGCGVGQFQAVLARGLEPVAADQVANLADGRGGHGNFNVPQTTVKKQQKTAYESSSQIEAPCPIHFAGFIAKWMGKRNTLLRAGSIKCHQFSAIVNRFRPSRSERPQNVFIWRNTIP